MTKKISAREARTRFAEITDRVRYTGEPVIVEKQGRPFVAVVSLDDLTEVERVREQRAANRFTALAFEAARETTGMEHTDDEIVAAVKRTRETLYRERYGRR
jgi:prevent-host-death family protein